ncbi:hypothetical protein [Deinococcus aestuarii]|nr:hypothetical protein [Deinococcus aestuarii]
MTSAGGRAPAPRGTGAPGPIWTPGGGITARITLCPLEWGDR